MDTRRLAPRTAAPSSIASRSSSGGQGPTAAERVIASELQSRGEASDALSMMVSSMARMVQAGRCSENRWTTG